MNRHDAYNAERDQITKQLGYHISLEEAANMVATAKKVISVVNGYSYAVSYREARLILRLADKMLEEISGGLE